MNNIENPSFKGNYCRSKNGYPYYKTNSGIKVGGALAGLGAISAATSLYKKNYSKTVLSLGCAAAYIACGAIYDNIRNKRAQKAANDIANMGMGNAMEYNDRLEISRKGNVYYNSNTGSKYGAMLGAGYGLAFGLATVSMKEQWANLVKSAAKDGIKVNKPIWVIASTAILAILGLIPGKIADYFSNKDAYKNS